MVPIPTTMSIPRSRAISIGPSRSVSSGRDRFQIRAEENKRRRESGGRSYDGENARRSERGKSYTNSNRRKGRPAWQRSPDDTPLRDGNRDRLMGLLTDRYGFDDCCCRRCCFCCCDLCLCVCVCRAAKTLLYYFFEMNPTLYGWFMQYMKEHKIPKEGSWDDISGETFLRELLTTPIEETNWGKQVVRPDNCCFMTSFCI